MASNNPPCRRKCFQCKKMTRVRVPGGGFGFVKCEECGARLGVYKLEPVVGERNEQNSNDLTPEPRSKAKGKRYTHNYKCPKCEGTLAKRPKNARGEPKFRCGRCVRYYVLRDGVLIDGPGKGGGARTHNQMCVKCRVWLHAKNPPDRARFTCPSCHARLDGRGVSLPTKGEPKHRCPSCNAAMRRIKGKQLQCWSCKRRWLKDGDNYVRGAGFTRKDRRCYLATSDYHKHVKIGRTVIGNQEKRLVNLRNGDPSIKFEVLFPCDCEILLHDELSHERMHGEWFSGPETRKLLRSAKKLFPQDGIISVGDYTATEVLEKLKTE